MAGFEEEMKQKLEALFKTLEPQGPLSQILLRNDELKRTKNDTVSSFERGLDLGGQTYDNDEIDEKVEIGDTSELFEKIFENKVPPGVL